MLFGAIQPVRKWNEMCGVELTQAAVRMDPHPAPWEPARGRLLPKLGKEDYTNLKTYQTISALSFMGEVSENVVAELLSDGAERTALLSPVQFSSRKIRLAIDTAGITVDRAHASWTENSIPGVLLMDIKAAFPSVARGRVIHVMKAKQIDGDLLQWAESFLSERTAQMVIEGNV